MSENFDLHRHPDGHHTRDDTPEPEEAATVTVRPGWVHLEAFGVELGLFRDGSTGAPVVEVDTPGLPETDGGPVMRVSVNDHDYLDNAAGDGETMTPTALAASPSGVFNADQSGALVAVGDEHRRLITELITYAYQAGEVPTTDPHVQRRYLAELDVLTRRVGAAGLCNGEVVTPEDEDTPGLTEPAGGDGESDAVARRELAAAIETVSAELAEHDDGTFRTLLLDAGVFQNCRRCGWTMTPADDECGGCGVDYGTALTDPDD